MAMARDMTAEELEAKATTHERARKQVLAWLEKASTEHPDAAVREAARITLAKAQHGKNHDGG